jgi:DNA-binding response OmpR family regulator
MAKHVLLIEDEPNIIEAISFILRQDGWKVSTHSDGTKAVAEIARVAPDLVILDVMLPGAAALKFFRICAVGPKPKNYRC